MKKLLALLLVFLSLTIPVLAETEVDLSAMSLYDLVALKDRINLAIWNSEEWQEVTVPQGVWLVGEDIPEGHWSIACTDGYCSRITIGTKLDATGYDIDTWSSDFYYSESVKNPKNIMFNENTDKTTIDLDLKEGTYVIIDSASAIFTPYSGKPSLSFNK